MAFKNLTLTSNYPTDLEAPGPDAHQRLRRRVLISLHSLALASSLISLSLFAAAIPQWNANFFHNSGPSRGDWTDGISIGPLTFAFLYHAAILIFDFIQKRQGQPPALPSLSRNLILIQSIVPTLVLASLMATLFVAGYGSLFRFWEPAVRTQSGGVVCNMLNIFARECEPTLYAVGSLQISGIVFGIVTWILHFMLVLISLRDLRRHRLIKQIQTEKLAQFESGSRPVRYS